MGEANHLWLQSLRQGTRLQKRGERAPIAPVPLSYEGAVTVFDGQGHIINQNANIVVGSTKRFLLELNLERINFLHMMLCI
jgi:hypothetical protein